MNVRISASLLLSCQSFVWLPVMAQNMLTVPTEVVRVSNPDLAAESRGSVTLFRIHPQYTLQSVQESSRMELSLGGMIERSSNTDLSASRTLPSVRALWENSSPIDVFALRASLEEASTRETEFVEFGRVTRDTTQRTGALGGSWVRNLTAGSSLELAVSHARVSYDAPTLIDYSETLGSGVYRFDSSAISRYSLSASASRLRPDGYGSSASRGELGLGYELDANEAVTLNATVGAVRTKTAHNRTDPVGAVRLTYAGERITYSAGWSREVSAGGTLGGYTRSESLDASLTYPLSVNTSVSLGLNHARSLEADRDTGASAYARIRWELTRFWAFTTGLEHRRAKPGGGSTARGNSVAAGLVYSHPDF